MNTMQITTQIGCGNSCAYCPQDKITSSYPKGASRRMSLDLFKQCLHKIPKDTYIHFSGMSEPWLNPECTRMLTYAHTQGFKIRVFTTLAGMTIADIEQLASIPLAGFRVHLPARESQMNIAVDDKYLDLLGRIASSASLKAVFNAHGHDIPSSITSLLNKHGKEIIILPLSTRAGNVPLPKAPSPSRKKRVLGCIRGLQQNVLLPNGDVLLCCVDWGMRHKIGNLLTSNYADLFLSQEFQRVRKGMWEPSEDTLCKYCDSFTYEIVLTDKVWRIIAHNLNRIPLLWRMWDQARK